MTSSLPRKRSTPELHWLFFRAEDEVRTRDPQLGRLMLYRLSYFRKKKVGRGGFEPPKAYASRFTVCPSWPLWYLPEPFQNFRADGGIRTPDQLITNQLLWPTELHRHDVFPVCFGIAKICFLFLPANIFFTFFKYFFLQFLFQLQISNLPLLNILLYLF